MTNDIDLESPHEMERTIRELTTRVAELRGLCHQAQSQLIEAMQGNGLLIAEVAALRAENALLKKENERMESECERLRDELHEANCHAKGDEE